VLPFQFGAPPPSIFEISDSDSDNRNGNAGLIFGTPGINWHTKTTKKNETFF